MNRSTPQRRFGLLLVGAAVAAALAGCTASPDPAPVPSTTVSAAPTQATPPAPATLDPQGSADDNLPVFTEVVRSVASGPEAQFGRAYIDALVAKGFDKAAMQVTEDETTVGNPAESIQFSVRWGEECLVGQVGPATGAPVTTVMSGLATGGCLVGETRPIDW